MSMNEYLRLMPLGDSLTQGTNSSDMAGYRAPLWTMLQAAGWPIQFVGSLLDGPADWPAQAHEGHYGWRVDQLSEEVEPWLRRYAPDVVLLHIGTNDLVQGTNPRIVAERLEQLLDRIRATLPQATTLVAQITPIGYEALNGRVGTYNSLIPGLVQRQVEQGADMLAVDMYQAVSIDTIADKLHTNDAGYAAIAHIWYAALQNCVKLQPSALPSTG